MNNDKDIYGDSPDELTIRYLKLSDAVTWDRNPKLHDFGDLSKSIVERGFLDPPKWDNNLNDGQGGIVEGNGRITALRQLKNGGYSPPKGIRVIDSEWYVPVLFGIDARSKADAEKYALDHNMMVLGGGDFDTHDLLNLHDPEQFKALLLDLYDSGDGLPITIDEEDMESLFSDYTERQEVDDNSDGNLIDKLDGINTGEPLTSVALGEVYIIEGKHLLVVCDPVFDVAGWIDYITPEHAFLPYPGVFVAFSADRTRPMLMVQPDPFIAGHILDRIKDIRGNQAVVKYNG